jgi:hypothetical protein
MKMKMCNRCNQTKSITDFYKSSYVKEGYRNQCKKCVISLQLQRTVKNVASSKVLMREIESNCKQGLQSRVEGTKIALKTVESIEDTHIKDYLNSLNMDCYTLVESNNSLYLIESWTALDYGYIEDKIKYCGIALTTKQVQDWIKEDNER